MPDDPINEIPKDEQTQTFSAKETSQFDSEDKSMNTLVERDASFDPHKESERMIQEALQMEEQLDQNGQSTVEKIDNLRNNTTLAQGINYLSGNPIEALADAPQTNSESGTNTDVENGAQPDSNAENPDNAEGEESDEDDPGLEVSEESEPDEPYLVRGALLHCRNGSHDRRLNLPRCHGVHSTEHPLITRLDCLPGDDQNIPTFGVCSSGKNPSKEKITLESYVPVDVDGKRQGEADSTVSGKPCVPVIVGTWLLTQDETRIVDNGEKDPDDRKLGRAQAKGQPMVTMKSFLVCKYGGLIEPMNCGQEYINPQERHSITGEKIDEKNADAEVCEIEGLHEH